MGNGKAFQNNNDYQKVMTAPAPTDTATGVEANTAIIMEHQEGAVLTSSAVAVVDKQNNDQQQLLRQRHLPVASPMEIESVVLKSEDNSDEPYIWFHRGHDPKKGKRMKRLSYAIMVVYIIFFIAYVSWLFNDDPLRYHQELVTPDQYQTILESCTLELIQGSENGRQACEDACAVASCCHTSDVSENCYYSKYKYCKHLYPCNLVKANYIDDNDDDDDEGVINNGGTTTTSSLLEPLVLPPPPPDYNLILDVCQHLGLEGYYSIDKTTTMDQCQDICKGAKCCFPTFGTLYPDLNCYNISDDTKKTCRTYKLCENIFYEPVGGIVNDDIYRENNDEKQVEPMTSGPIYDACDPSKIQKDDVAKLICTQLCANFQCCFIRVPDIGMCDYDQSCQTLGAPCEILYNSSYVRPTAVPVITNATSSKYINETKNIINNDEN